MKDLRPQIAKDYRAGFRGSGGGGWRKRVRPGGAPGASAVQLAMGASITSSSPSNSRQLQLQLAIGSAGIRNKLKGPHSRRQALAIGRYRGLKLKLVHLELPSSSAHGHMYMLYICNRRQDLFSFEGIRIRTSGGLYLPLRSALCAINWRLASASGWRGSPGQGGRLLRSIQNRQI